MPEVDSRKRARIALVVAALAAAALAAVVFGQDRGPYATGCWGYSQAGGTSLANIQKMVTVSVGWATGALRTTDGGLDWRDVSPPGLWEDAPSLFARQSLDPPSYADFYLDGDHAWAARGFRSASSCSDHLVTYVTRDGGHTWTPSAPLYLRLAAGLQATAPLLYFGDPQHGWMVVFAGKPGPGQFLNTVESVVLYQTADGGLNWHQVSNLLAADRCFANVLQMTFLSATQGFATLSCPFGEPTIAATHDGGKTWELQSMPFLVESAFFNTFRGIVAIGSSTTQSGAQLLSTSDGAKTWEPLPDPPGAGSTVVIDFVDTNDFWDLVTQPGWVAGLSPPGDWLYRTTDGGRTWTLVAKDLAMGDRVAYFHFVDADHGFVSQDSPNEPAGPVELNTTSDGGRTWNIVVPQVTRP